MTILKRFTIRTAVVSIIKSESGVEIEIIGTKNPEELQAAKKYLHDEGIIQSILSSREGLAFEKIDIEKLLTNKT